METGGSKECRELVCIGCPLGCNVTVELEDGRIGQITGNTCPRGADYVTKELTDPRRIVTSLVRVIGGELAVAPVKTASAIPKGLIMDCVRALKETELEAPVHIGDVALSNVCGTGVDVVVTANVGEKTKEI